MRFECDTIYFYDGDLMNTNNVMKNENASVIAIKTISGVDILGFYAGEVQIDVPKESGLMIYRPIKIELISNYHPEGISSSYYPKFFFPYGDIVTPLPYRSIAHQEQANPFFSRLYEKFLEDLLEVEDLRHEAMTKAFDRDDYRKAMVGTDSILIDIFSKIIH